MKTRLAFTLLVALPLATVLSPNNATAENLADPPAPRKQYRETRPDESRGWLIVTKRSYWPLCFESLDRLEEVYGNIGKVAPEELAGQLEKCGAWLQLAADASFTNEQGGVSETAEYCFQAAEALREESDTWSSETLKDLVVLGELSMANSHILRATALDEGKKFQTEVVQKSTPANLVKTVNSLESEIRSERLIRDREQYRYDTVETQRHLDVAITYLKSARTHGNLDIDPALLVDVPELEKTVKGEAVVNFVGIELRPRLAALRGTISALLADQKKRLAKLDQ